MEKEEEKNVDHHFFLLGKKKGFNPSFLGGAAGFSGFRFLYLDATLEGRSWYSVCK